MILDENPVFWIFSIGFVASFVASLCMLERMYQQLDQRTPSPRNSLFGPAWLSENLLSRYVGLLARHQERYPESKMRSAFVFASCSMIPCLIGLILRF